jgi:hypothetical protein
MASDEPRDGGAAYAVGYKRPPKEHQFKKGQRPPPRKKAAMQEKPFGLYWRVLQEPRRAVINGKAHWGTTAELLARRALMESVKENGSSTVRRLLHELLLEQPTGSDDEEPHEFLILP